MVIVAICALVSPAVWAAVKREMLPPPKFDKETVSLFTDDARTKLGPGGPGTVRPAGGTGAPAGGGAAAPEAVAVGDMKWSQLISGENLEAEVKSLQPVISEATKTINNFKGNGREKAQTGFTELATLFGVISQFDGDVRWKKDALGLEKAFAQAGFNCKTSSDAAYKEAQKRTQELADMIRGGTIDLPKAEPGTPWPEVANRPALMRRMEEARQGGKVGKWISNKSEFKKNKDALMREAQVLAMISQVIKDKGFESADDDTYQKFAAEFQSECLQLVDAIKADDPEKAQSVFAKVGKACDTCHGDFR